MPAYVFDQKNERDGSTSVESGQTLTITWEAVTDTSSVDAGDIIAALDSIVGIGKGDPHPTYPLARCTDIRAAVDPRDPYRWNVAATFTEPRALPGTSETPDPPDREPWVRGGTRREDAFRGIDNTPEESGFFTRHPRPFTNSAGDPLDNPPAIPLGVGQLVITKYFDTISYVALRAYQNCCNAETFFDFPAHSLCVMQVEWAPHSERGWDGWKVTFTLEHREVTPEQLAITDDNLNGAGTNNPFVGPIADLELDENEDLVITGGFHPIAVLDVGFYTQVDTGSGYVRKPYYDPPDSGVPKTVPGFLNGVGGVADTEPHYLAFDIHPRISFDIMLPP